MTGRWNSREILYESKMWHAILSKMNKTKILFKARKQAISQLWMKVFIRFLLHRKEMFALIIRVLFTKVHFPESGWSINWRIIRPPQKETRPRVQILFKSLMRETRDFVFRDYDEFANFVKWVAKIAKITKRINYLFASSSDVRAGYSSFFIDTFLVFRDIKNWITRQNCWFRWWRWWYIL